MSKYSGKCDFYDSLYMGDGNPDFSKIVVYPSIEAVVPLRIDCKKDAVPYYPFLTVMSTGDGEGRRVYWLSSQSFVDHEEQEHLSGYLDDFKRYYRKCKRNHKEYNAQEAIEKCAFFAPQDWHIELANRVRLQGDKAKIDGVHTNYHQHMRSDLYNEMLRVGYTETQAKKWVYHSWF